jgi:hypothetical protein
MSWPTEELYIDNPFAGDESAIDNDDNRKEFPECFVFECCNGNLRDHPGCEFDFHEERSLDDGPSKKARLYLL